MGKRDRKRKLETWGWLLFMGSALCFAVAGLLAGDPWSLSGSVLFFVACFFFLVPQVQERPSIGTERDSQSA
ncbi:hypothetical protein SAMN02746041_00726 [Desulfacinum hydrothermale DSM 13146]|uniref:Cytochrome oxidase subunit III n=1 Tax=Desulfacinum hydrothermale DSM 13146 TaxID=1121390 RepID=A0A1W1X6P1_9BACT|nr:hypothetical protein [Desulfacinum hydrothermale]SMC19606.1 hypothetical protein SAMN02746041_00726 [Desulfacinum hydrothermale DSM 13146]